MVLKISRSMILLKGSLIAKSEVYGFNRKDIRLIYSYLAKSNPKSQNRVHL